MIDGTGVVQQFVSYLIDQLGASPGSMIRPSLMSGRNSMEYNAFQANNFAEYRNAFGNEVMRIQQAATANAIRGMYRRSGMDEAAINNAFDPSTVSGTAQMIAGNFAMPDMRTGLNNIFNAAYKRRGDYWTYGQDATEGMHLNSYATVYRTFGRELLRSHLEDKSFGSLGFSDVGELTGELIGTGKYSATKDGSDLGDKLNNMKQDLVGYARSMSTLKDIIDGPVSDIVKKLEAFTGGNVLNMSTARLQSVASGLRQAVMLNGVSLNDIGAMGGISMSAIMPYGGTQGMAAQAAVSASYALAGGIQVEGIGRNAAMAATSQAIGNLMSGGAARDFSAAMMAWSVANGKDYNDSNTFLAFQRALGSEGATLANLQRVAGVDAATWQSFRNSDEAVKLAETHPIGASLLLTEADRAVAGRDRRLLEIAGSMGLSQVDEAFLTDTSNLTQDQFLARVKGAYGEAYSPEIASKAMEYATVRRNMSAFAGMNGASSEAVIANREVMRKNLQTQLLRNQLQYTRTATGVEGILQYYSAAESAMGSGNLSDILMSAHGVSRYAQLSEEEKNRLRTMSEDEVAQELGINMSAVAGLRSTYDTELQVIQAAYSGGGSADFTQEALKRAGLQGKSIESLSVPEANKYAAAAQNYHTELKQQYLSGLGSAADKDAYRQQNADMFHELIKGSSVENASTLDMLGRLGILGEYSTAKDISRRNDLEGKAAQAGKIVSYDADITDEELKRLVNLSTSLSQAGSTERGIASKVMQGTKISEAEVAALTNAGISQEALTESVNQLGSAANAIDALIPKSSTESILSEILNLIKGYLGMAGAQLTGSPVPGTQ